NAKRAITLMNSGGKLNSFAPPNRILPRSIPAKSSSRRLGILNLFEMIEEINPMRKTTVSSVRNNNDKSIFTSFL
ncbi:MAG: hypothetical protein QF632_05155, partial [Candidatus Woesearchaeota archaeon]|nr:hypothetical protein [Candidatus Woesearchaeota archaeon]